MNKRILFTMAFVLQGICSLTAQTAPSRFPATTDQPVLEKIYARTDKNTYLAGEIIWFKLYCLTETSHRPSEVSRIVYGELLNAKNQPVLHSKNSLTNGSGDGSFFLPGALPTGNYKLRFYTNWLKNTGPEHYFEKQITILNTLKEESRGPALANNTNEIQFFPEGGDIILNQPSKVAFKISSQNNRGVAASAALINSRSDTLLRFSSSGRGIGSFVFTPVANEVYRVVVKGGPAGQPLMSNLPTIMPGGVSMMLTRTANGVKLDVQTSALRDSLFLVVHSGSVTKLVKGYKPTNGKALFELSEQQLDEGVSTLTIFNGAKQPVCERLYFKKPSTSALSIAAAADGQGYKTRQKVTVALDGSSLPSTAKTDLSVSVYRIDSIAPETFSGSMASYLWLTSDLQGGVEDPDYYLDRASAEEIDNLMLTHGWRRFKNEQALIPAVTFQPEHEGHIVTAKLTGTQNGQPVANLMVYMSVPGVRTQMYASKSNKDGIVNFFTRDLVGQNEIILQTDTAYMKTTSINIQDPFSNQYSSAPVQAFDYLPLSLSPLADAGLFMQIRNVYSSDSLRRVSYPPINSMPFFTPMRRYVLNDYTRFPTMDEVLREYVPEVMVSSRRGGYDIKVRDIEQNAYNELESSPLVLVDGVPVFDFNRVMKYDPKKIEKLETVYKKAYYGQLVTNGIVSFTTYKGDLGGFDIDPGLTVVDYEGIQLKREFYSPDHSPGSTTRIPDMRTTLFWSPSVSLANKSTQAEFFTSDVPGRYIGIVEGITDSGKVVMGKFDLVVTGD